MFFCSCRHGAKAREGCFVLSKSLWFGSGSYSNFGVSAPTNPYNLRADPNRWDKLVELCGVKEKTKEEPDDKRK